MVDGWTAEATADDGVAVAPDLYFSRRGDEVLIVEGDSASWIVLDRLRWTVFQRMRETEPGSAAAVLANIAYADALSEAQFWDLVHDLYVRNIVSLSGARYFDSEALWAVQRYPHYFNIHVTEACNLSCRYCRVSAERRAPRMSPDTMRRIVRRILEDVPQDAVSLGFHGGEPLLNMDAIRAGVDEAGTAVSRLKARGTRKTVKFCLQSNGTLLSAKTVKALRALDIKVGVSLDGPCELHDRQRVFNGGKGSHAYVERGMKAAAAGGLKIGLLSVVHDPKTYVDVLDYMVRERGLTSTRINFSMCEGRAKDQLDFADDRGGHFASEWLKMVDYAEAHHADTGIWLDIDDLNLFVYHLISKRRPMMCYRSPCGIGNSILGFDCDGGIYLCDEVVGNERFRIGDIAETRNLAALLDESPVKRRAMAARQVENIAKCASCPWRRFHGSGCASKTFAWHGDADHADPMCRFYAVVFEELMWRLWKRPDLARLGGRHARAVAFDGTLPVHD